MTTKKLTKLLALYLPYILLGLVATNFGEAWRLAEGKELGDKIMSMMGTIPLAFAKPAAQSAPPGFAGGLLRRRGRSPRGAHNAQPTHIAPRAPPVECIILSVNDTYMDAQEVMHMTDYSKITALYSRLSVGDEGQGRRREQQHTEPKNIFGELCQRAAPNQYPALHRR